MILSTATLAALASVTIFTAPNYARQQAFSLNSLVGQLVGPPELGAPPTDAGSVSVVATTADAPMTAWRSSDSSDTLRTYVEQSGITYELLKHPEFPNHQIRMRSPRLCDTSVKQYSGYLDIDDDKHLFFWFFESRRNPSEAPLVLWLNGGPGCSSSTGILFELGPCRIADNGLNTTYNKNGWNEFANMIFLDQPVNVGYSYSEHGKNVNNSPAAAEDVYAFLQLFLNRFSEYDAASFSVAAESYGGHYAPHIASTIYKKNKALKSNDVRSTVKHINLSTIIIGNGLTDPLNQAPSTAKQACDGPYPIYDDPDGPECTSLRSKVPMCQRLIRTCYNYNSRLTCVPAGLYCSQLWNPPSQRGYNPYDLRKKCDTSEDKDGPLCYREMSWIDTYMNDPTVKMELGANPSVKFVSCNDRINLAFHAQGDSMKNSAALLPELLADGIRLLIYAGNADFVCNAIGNLAWMEHLDHIFAQEFNDAALLPWRTSNTGRVAGKVKTAGGGGSTAGNFTYVVVHEAGHMVPFDQPEAALDLFVRWLMDVPLA